MPANKNAVTRYKYLDDLLSDRHHYYDIHDLVEKVNEKLINDGFPEVGQRCIEKDINYLEYAPFSADIERYRAGGRACIRYKNPYFSIFTKELSNEEANLLSEVLNTIGQFDGLDNFDWLDRFQIGLGLVERRKIISFSKNPYLKNSNLLGTLFDMISNRQVIELSYHTFDDETIRSIDFHPYLLKQYNNRWYVIGAADSDMFILHFALDRIDGVKALPEKKYVECDKDLEERFEDIIGVTIPKDKKAEDILLWVDDTSYNLIETKPLHGSQTIIKGEEELSCHSKYPRYKDGHFVKLRCIINKELKRELCQFFGGMVILEPTGLREDIKAKICDMQEKYFQERT